METKTVLAKTGWGDEAMMPTENDIQHSMPAQLFLIQYAILNAMESVSCLSY